MCFFLMEKWYIIVRIRVQEPFQRHTHMEHFPKCRGLFYNSLAYATQYHSCSLKSTPTHNRGFPLHIMSTISGYYLWRGQECTGDRE